jgi:hypothetical protein|nr:MAG TPA: hypothetical protein [Caudoviricetes sp.]
MKMENVKRIRHLTKTLKGLHYTPSGLEEITKSWLGYALGASVGYEISDVIDDGFAAKKIEFFEIPLPKKAKKNRFIIVRHAAETDEFTFYSIGIAERLENSAEKFQALINDFSPKGALPKEGILSYQVHRKNEVYRVLVWGKHVLAVWNVKYNKIYVSRKANYYCKKSARLLKEFAEYVQSCLNGCNETAVLQYAHFE